MTAKMIKCVRHAPWITIVERVEGSAYGYRVTTTNTTRHIQPQSFVDTLEEAEQAVDNHKREVSELEAYGFATQSAFEGGHPG